MFYIDAGRIHRSYRSHHAAPKLSFPTAQTGWISWIMGQPHSFSHRTLELAGTPHAHFAHHTHGPGGTGSRTEVFRLPTQAWHTSTVRPQAREPTHQTAPLTTLYLSASDNGAEDWLTSFHSVNFHEKPKVQVLFEVLGEHNM